MKKYTIIIFVLILSAILVQMGCENNYPDSIWDPAYNSKPTPVISDIIPDSSYSGIGVITIVGQNFSADISENRVFIGGKAATVLSASETSLDVQVPTLVEDSLLIQIDVKDAFELGEYGGTGSSDVPFRLIDATINYVKVDENLSMNGLACDLSENIYSVLETRRAIKFIHPDSGYVDVGNSSPPAVVTSMKTGPGGYVCFVKNNTYIYRLPPGSGSSDVAEKWVRFDGKVKDLDFDENLNVFAGGDTTIFRARWSDADTAIVALYPSYEIKLLRVYNGYVYVFLSYTGSDSMMVQNGIWRNEILDASGNLGSNEFMYDWSTYVAGAAGIKVNTMVVDENGLFYLGLDYSGNYLNEAIIKVDIFSGFAEPLYTEILNAGVNNLCWGNSNNLYIHRYLLVESGEETIITRKLFTLAMPVNSAPYYGRQ